MREIDFFRPDVSATVKSLRALAEDLERMTVFRPGERELADAPVLERWTVQYRPILALTGVGHDHPLLGTRPIITSEVYAMDADARWARTWSRFYRLGPPAHG